ncbi:MAG: hypothetical protein HW390_1528 [Candidatus Brocadiaceae bacterium]|nr:hypothetical protein [Candidatus Brocadiaceae bacterium]
MNEREINPNTQNNITTTPRPWIEPTFERVALNEAMTGSGAFAALDFSTYAS